MTTFQPHYPAQSSSAAAESNRSQRKERQTRLQEHLRSVKPGSRSSSPSNNSFKQSITPAGSASMGKTARKSVPSAAATKKGSTPASKASEEPAPELSASGRPKRRAAKSRIVLADLESSGAEEDDDDQDDQDDQDDAEQNQAAEPEAPAPRSAATSSSRRRGGSKARNQPRQAIPLAQQEPIEDLAPSPSPKSRTSVGRKSPAKQVQSSQRRKREASNSSTGSRSAQSSPYRVDPAAMQKRQFRSVLAQHGFNPEEEVLDRALYTMSSTNQALTVDSFLRVLGTLDANVSPLKRSSMGSAPQLSVSVGSAPSATSKLSGFAALESPSTPSSAIDPRFLPSPPLTQSPAPRSQAGPYSYTANYSQSFAPMMVPAESLPVPSSAFAPNGPVPARPTFSSNRSASTPNVPTLEAAMLATNPAPLADGSPSPRQQPQSGASAGGLFATSVAGMGRVALSRRSMFGQPSSASAPAANLPRVAESSPTRASFHQMSPPSRSSPGPLPSPVAATNGKNGLLPAFAFGASGAPVQNAARSRASSLSKSSSPVKPADDARLAKLRSWLDEDDETTEEEEVKANSQQTGEAEASLKASAASSKLVSSLAALGTIGDVFDNQPMTIPQISALQQETTQGGDDPVGNAALRQSQKRQLEPTAEEVEAASKMTTRASARASTADKGKGKAVNDCFCGEAADGQPRTVECSACETPYHLACLAVTSARQLPTPFVCARCELPTAIKEPEPEHESATLSAGQRTPELANKRVRIGTTSTPLLMSEPTFVASTPLSAPRGDAFGPLVADLALAPSPTASPVRRFATTRTPTSPPAQSHAQLPIPMTPSFGDATIRGPGDYSPTSPQNTRARAARTRLVSNTGAAFLGGNSGSEWLEPWDSQPFAAADSMQAQASSSALSSLAEDDWRMPSWSDVNMTPSRALTRDTPATSASSSVWDTPFAHSSPQSRHRTVNFGHMRTPSHDLLAMLDREQAGNLAQSEPAHHTFSQRLFGGSPHSAQESHHYDVNNHHSMPLGHPASPLNPRRYSALGHARKTSLGDGLGRAPFGSPTSPAHAHAYLPAHMHGLGSTSMKPSFSAPGGRLVDLMPSMGDFDEPQHLDDLLL